MLGMNPEMTFFFGLVALFLGYKLVKSYLAHHYRMAQAQDERLTAAHHAALPELYQKARDAEERIAMLEQILDTDLPQWRKR